MNPSFKGNEKKYNYSHLQRGNYDQNHMKIVMKLQIMKMKLEEKNEKKLRK